jgi:phosphohistidine phosphatase
MKTAGRNHKIMWECFDSSLCFGHNAITNFVNKFGDVSIDNVPTRVCIFRIWYRKLGKIKKGKLKKIIVPKDLK